MIKNVESIKKLNLRNNDFKSLPKTLKNMPLLEALDISANKIENLQESSFLNLHNLKMLNMSDSLKNGSNLDRQLCELIQIEVLDLSYLDLANFNLECWSKEKGTVKFLILIISVLFYNKPMRDDQTYPVSYFLRVHP